MSNQISFSDIWLSNSNETIEPNSLDSYMGRGAGKMKQQFLTMARANHYLLRNAQNKGYVPKGLTPKTNPNRIYSELSKSVQSLINGCGKEIVKLLVTHFTTFIEDAKHEFTCIEETVSHNLRNECNSAELLRGTQSGQTRNLKLSLRH